MKRFLLIAALALLAFIGLREAGFLPDTATPTFTDSSTPAGDALRSAYENHDSNLQVRGAGVVVRVLSDDNYGSRHQRFILRTSTGQTLLVAHNIDLADRISGLKAGDRIEFYGEYEWNDKGGVIHWTHHDPQGRHEGGWLKRGGRTYK